MRHRRIWLMSKHRLHMLEIRLGRSSILKIAIGSSMIKAYNNNRWGSYLAETPNIPNSLFPCNLASLSTRKSRETWFTQVSTSKRSDSSSRNDKSNAQRTIIWRTKVTKIQSKMSQRWPWVGEFLSTMKNFCFKSSKLKISMRLTFKRSMLLKAQVSAA